MATALTNIDIMMKRKNKEQLKLEQNILTLAFYKIQFDPKKN